MSLEENLKYENIFEPEKRKEYTAFTLAEVLITLGIIGVVAAMTLPTLLTNIQEKVLEAQAKKAKSRVANGYKLMMAHYEIFKVENLPFLSSCNSMNDKECVSREHKEAFAVTNDNSGGLTITHLPESYAINGNDRPSPFKWEDVPYIFTTGDGMMFGVIPADDFTSFDVVVDVNGKNNPNIAKKDLYKYRLAGEGGQLYDVSDELEQVVACTNENPGDCETQQDCEAMCAIYGANFTWCAWNGSSCDAYER